jgi:hypothetical protein
MVLSELVQVRERLAGEVSWSDTVAAPTVAGWFSQVERACVGRIRVGGWLK